MKFRRRGLDGANLFYAVQDSLIKSGLKFPNTWFELDWVNKWNFADDQDFEEPHFRNTFRRYFLTQVVIASEKLDIQGKNIEFGIFNGYGSKLILENSTRDLLMVDTFRGMSTPNDVDGTFWAKGDMARQLDLVQKKLSNYSHRTQYFVGEIPEILAMLPKEDIVFAHIDVDLNTPTYESLNWVSNFLVPGGLIICDDYGFETCPGATIACDQFISENSEFFILPMPVGGALIQRNTGEGFSNVQNPHY